MWPHAAARIDPVREKLPVRRVVEVRGSQACGRRRAARDQHPAVAQQRRRVAAARRCQRSRPLEAAGRRVVELGGPHRSSSSKPPAISTRPSRSSVAVWPDLTLVISPVGAERPRLRVVELRARERGFSRADAAGDEHAAVGEQRRGVRRPLHLHRGAGRQGRHAAGSGRGREQGEEEQGNGCAHAVSTPEAKRRFRLGSYLRAAHRAPPEDHLRRPQLLAIMPRSRASTLPERPLLFAKWPNTLIGPGRADRHPVDHASVSTTRPSSASSSAAARAGSRSRTRWRPSPATSARTTSPRATSSSRTASGCAASRSTRSAPSGLSSCLPPTSPIRRRSASGPSSTAR